MVIYFFVIISVSFFLKNHNGRTDYVRYAEARINLYQEALRNFRRDTGDFPSNTEGLNALIFKPNNIKNWNGPYLNYSFIIKDSWGNEYRYIKVSANKFELYSIGQNEMDENGNGDDIKYDN